MASRLMLICQGATTATRRSAFPADEPLEERALSAAGAVRLAWRAERGWVSPMRAARQTAGIVSPDCKEDPGLRDLDYGEWTGRIITEIAQEQPDRLAQWLGDPEFDGHGGESIAGLLRRAGAWLDGRAPERGRTVAVTHSAVIRAMVVHVLGAPPQAFWRVDIAPLTLSVISHDGRRWTLRSCGVAM